VLSPDIPRAESMLPVTTPDAPGLLKIEIGGRDLSQHDLLSVGGTANLNGILQLVRLNNFKFKRNKPVTFLTAGGGGDGQFNHGSQRLRQRTTWNRPWSIIRTACALGSGAGSFTKFGPKLESHSKTAGRRRRPRQSSGQIATPMRSSSSSTIAAQRPAA